MEKKYGVILIIVTYAIAFCIGHFSAKINEQDLIAAKLDGFNHCIGVTKEK